MKHSTALLLFNKIIVTPETSRLLKRSDFLGLKVKRSGSSGRLKNGPFLYGEKVLVQQTRELFMC